MRQGTTSEKGNERKDDPVRRVEECCSVDHITMPLLRDHSEKENRQRYLENNCHPKIECFKDDDEL